MTPDEFEFWQKAYLAALTGLTAMVGLSESEECSLATGSANYAVEAYRVAKASVANKVQSVGPAGD